jgi:hypothetical protein
MFAERARNIFDRVTIFISACLLGVFAMSSKIVTSRSFGFLLWRTVCYVAQNTRAVLAETFLDPPRVAFLVASNLAKAGAMLETEGHEKHNGNREHEYKAENDEGERRGGGHGRKV